MQAAKRFMAFTTRSENETMTETGDAYWQRQQTTGNSPYAENNLHVPEL